MDYSIIDKLYDSYLNDDSIDVENNLRSHQYLPGFIETVQSYIKEQTKLISNNYVSNVDEKNKVDLIVKQTTDAFEVLLDPIQTLIINYACKDSYFDIFDDEMEHIEIKPHDLFSISMKLMEDAIEKYSKNKETFEKVKKLILYVRKHKLIQELYPDDSWKDMNFGELIATLYDKAKDKSVFEGEYAGVLDNEDTLFGRVKSNCRNVTAISFDKYRSKLNTNKQLLVQYGKLIFCKNLLMFYDTDILIKKDGLIDCTADFTEKLKLKDSFKKLYSHRFDETKFRENQTNFICKPEIITNTTKLEARKSVNFGNRMIMGFLISATTSLFSSFNYEVQYLIHINIEDVNNPCSNYEMQLNLIPAGKISKRLQLLRLDNWANEQPHKNVGNKLKTRTHIHIYNEFDLLRGKVNGNFDIAYNLNSKSTEFNTALETFLDILELDNDSRAEIYNSTMEALDNCKKSLETLC